MASTDYDEFDSFLDHMDEEADQEDANNARDTSREVLRLFRRIFRSLSPHIQEQFLKHTRQAYQTGRNQADPMAALRTLVGGMQQPAALPASGNSAANTDKADSNDASSGITPEQRALLDVFEGQPVDRLNWARRTLSGILRKDGDDLLGALQAIEDIGDGALRVNADGRPQTLEAANTRQLELEQELDQVNQQLNQANRRTRDLQRQVDARPSPAPANTTSTTVDPNPQLVQAAREAVEQAYSSLGLVYEQDADLNDPASLVRHLEVIRDYIHREIANWHTQLQGSRADVDQLRSELSAANGKLQNNDDAKRTAERAQSALQAKLNAVNTAFGPLERALENLTGGRWTDETGIVQEAKDAANNVDNELNR